VSGEKRNVSGNAFASALKAWQPAVGIRECHRIFCCTSYCLRALSVCVPLLRAGTVSAAGACLSGASSLSCGLLPRRHGGHGGSCSHQFVRREKFARWRQRIPVLCAVVASDVSVGLFFTIGRPHSGLLSFGGCREVV
jgi:hypothetical protein